MITEIFRVWFSQKSNIKVLVLCGIVPGSIDLVPGSIAGFAKPINKVSLLLRRNEEIVPASSDSQSIQL